MANVEVPLDRQSLVDIKRGLGISSADADKFDVFLAYHSKQVLIYTGLRKQHRPLFGYLLAPQHASEGVTSRGVGQRRNLLICAAL